MHKKCSMQGFFRNNNILYIFPIQYYALSKKQRILKFLLNAPENVC